MLACSICVSVSSFYEYRSRLVSLAVSGLPAYHCSQRLTSNLLARTPSFILSTTSGRSASLVIYAAYYM
eukprot:2747412-Pyramimonas_sp.AAC.1